MVIRGPGGVGRQLGAEHSQRLESYFQSIPGVQLVACSTVANAKALLKSAIRSNNPIIFFEHVLLYNVKGGRVSGAASRLSVGLLPITCAYPQEADGPLCMQCRRADDPRAYSVSEAVGLWAS
jgi:pyruvate/2-oxoglutarate/acetoin dehydrogenase E1 component